MIKNECNNYQKSNEGNSAKWRIENLDLRQFASKDKTLLDLGANHGEFGVELTKDFMHVSTVEPVVEAPENMPENMTWFKKTLKEFCVDHNDTYDVVFSFAMTIQVRDNDGLNEDEIAQRHYDLVKENGMMIYETQKLENRPLNQAHVDKMLKSFRDKFNNETSSGNARVSGNKESIISLKNDFFLNSKKTTANQFEAFIEKQDNRFFPIMQKDTNEKYYNFHWPEKL